MKRNAFYGTSDQASLSYLEFGAIDLARGTKAVWDFRTNQKAYDWLMLARYANDMAAYLDMIEAVEAGRVLDALETYRREVHHHDDFSVNLGKLLAVTVCSRKNSHPVFFELGQTLFGCIEGMECCRTMATALKIHNSFPDLKDIIWYGVDISRLFNRFAVRMHPGYSVTVGKISRVYRNIQRFSSQRESRCYTRFDLSKICLACSSGARWRYSIIRCQRGHGRRSLSARVRQSSIYPWTSS